MVTHIQCCAAQLYVKIRRYRVKTHGRHGGGGEHVVFFSFLCRSRLRIANLSLCLRTSVEHVGCDVKSHCVRSFTLSNPQALVFDLTRDEVADELRTWHGSLATAGEFTTESQSCFLNLNHNVAFFEPQLRSQLDFARSNGIAWGNHDGEPRIGADKKDVCRSDRLGKATSVH